MILFNCFAEYIEGLIAVMTILYIKAQWFFFCLSGNYFGTGKGYKLEIWLEGVVSKYKERFFF